VACSEHAAITFHSSWPGVVRLPTTLPPPFTVTSAKAGTEVGGQVLVFLSCFRGNDARGLPAISSRPPTRGPAMARPAHQLFGTGQWRGQSPAGQEKTAGRNCHDPAGPV